MSPLFEYRSCKKKECEYNGDPHQHRTLVTGDPDPFSDEYECPTPISTVTSVSSSEYGNGRLQTSSERRRIFSPRRISRQVGLRLGAAFSDSFRSRRHRRLSSRVLDQGYGEYGRLKSTSTVSTEIPSTIRERKSSRLSEVSGSTVIDPEDQLSQSHPLTTLSSAMGPFKPRSRNALDRERNCSNLYSSHLSGVGFEAYKKTRGIGTENQRIPRLNSFQESEDDQMLRLLPNWKTHGQPDEPQVLTVMQATTLPSGPETITQITSLATTHTSQLKTQEDQTLLPSSEIRSTPQPNVPTIKVTRAVTLRRESLVGETIKCTEFLMPITGNIPSVRKEVWQEAHCPDTDDRLMFDRDAAASIQADDTSRVREKEAEQEDSQLWNQSVAERREAEQRYIDNMAERGVSVSTLPLPVKLEQNIARKEQRLTDRTSVGSTPAESKSMQEKIKKVKTFFKDKKEELSSRHSDRKRERKMGKPVDGHFNKAFSLCWTNSEKEQDDQVSPHSTPKLNAENKSDSDGAVMTMAMPDEQV